MRREAEEADVTGEGINETGGRRGRRYRKAEETDVTRKASSRNDWRVEILRRRDYGAATSRSKIVGCIIVRFQSIKGPKGQLELHCESISIWRRRLAHFCSLLFPLFFMPNLPLGKLLPPYTQSCNTTLL
ncbi:hypothetical protein ACMD2_02438 [Ananas comosus]|uniref:Uncharacterized protein n=1 Tax=Ananas comosus TaxID=4615 RepID=A0A199UWD4_ANACO|nr:hypothetical protein ACMD2_02438 [Ananas comosus]